MAADLAPASEQYTQEERRRLYQPELVFGFVRALGTDVDVVVAPLTSALEEANFHMSEIHISTEFRSLVPLNETLEERPLDRYYETHMDAGDMLRASTERTDAVAMLGVRRLRVERQRLLSASEYTARGRAYVLRHLMTRGEVETMRQIYGDRLFVIGVFSPEDIRERELTTRIAQSRGTTPALCRPRAIKLLNRDFGMVDPDDPVQQEVLQDPRCRLNVRKTFQEADLFLSAAAVDESKQAMRRFIESVFGHPFHTPTKDEFGMAVAQLAALRSGDLSRRVGAAIVTPDGQLLATGTNEAPKFGGGQYWSDDSPDWRDWKLGTDSSDRIRRELLDDIVRRLVEDPAWLIDGLAATDAEPIKQHLGKLDQDAAVKRAVRSDAIRDSRMLDVTEYGRSVHAEMAAMMDAVRRGIAIAGAVLYTTTYPCHQCARHVIASGIRRVVYIEPYPKSRAGEIYEREIGLGDKRADVEGRVLFEPFVGVAPRPLAKLMSWVSRKASDVPGAEPLSGRIAPHSLATAPIRRSIADEQAIAAGAMAVSTDAMERYFVHPFEALLEAALRSMDAKRG